MLRATVGLSGSASRDRTAIHIDQAEGPAARFFAARGALAGQISIGGDFEFTDAELDELLDDAG